MESKPLIYMSHPVSPIEGETYDGNISDAMGWLVALIEHRPDWVVIAPWISEILANGVDADKDPAKRDAALERCAAVASRCDGIVLCGPRISEGMKVEARPVWDALKPVHWAQRLMHRRPAGIHIADLTTWTHQFINGVPRFLIQEAVQRYNGLTPGEKAAKATEESDQLRARVADLERERDIALAKAEEMEDRAINVERMLASQP